MRPGRGARAGRARHSRPGRRRRPAPGPGDRKVILPLRSGSPEAQSFRGSTITSWPRKNSRAASIVSAVACAPGVGQLAGADRAAAARLRVRIVQRLLQELHQAALAVRVRRIRSASAARTCAQRGPLALRRSTSGLPVATQPPAAALRPTSSTARILSMVSSRPRRIPVAVSRPPGRTGRSSRQRIEDPLDLSLVGDAGGGEVVPDPLVGLGRAPAPPPRRPGPDRPGRPAGSRPPARPASRGGCRRPGRACRSPCRAPTSPPAP